MDQPTAETALRALEPLIGTWDLAIAWPDGTPWPGGGRQVIEWLPDHAHVIQRGEIDLPEAPASVAIIGCDGAKGTFTQLYSDERGVCRIYDMSIDDTEWQLWRQGEPFEQRFVGRFSNDGRTITARWEAAKSGGELETDFDMVWTKVD
ncbi:hypothetical protein [Gordonia soli]|uniref:DUF1579 domain-containing protein n=1 Tax=Gordonia soli NBRC 108243 TaxID=1223545 RepID=M0QKP9_9ACTN|nr:hypothetical protein [Gordonia soli]GAC69215.1 hypothetical protein GS4_23_00090 [Gordonia soli NBRC 108243]